MRVGITGASGLIGTELVRVLQKRGDEVVRFVRPQTLSASKEIIRWDPSRGHVDENDLKNAGSLDALIHLAGAGIGDKRWNEKRKGEILSSRTNSTNLLVATLRSMQGGVPHLISGSAIGFYGNRDNEILSETSTHGIVWNHNKSVLFSKISKKQQHGKLTEINRQEAARQKDCVVNEIQHAKWISELG